MFGIFLVFHSTFSYLLSCFLFFLPLRTSVVFAGP